MMEVRLLATDAELELVSPILLQLRPDYSQAGLIDQIKRQQVLGYQVAYVIEEKRVLCVAGFIIGSKLGWKKHLYVDDLVTTSTHRSKGAGKKLLDWLREYALSHGCQQFHLDSGVQRFEAHRFYLREGFKISSHHFAITDLHANSK